MLRIFDFQPERAESYHVLRDDIIAGGTKRRALNLLLQNITNENVYYAGTTMGHGALALAHACTDAGKTAHIFISGREEQDSIQKLRMAGAQVYVQPPHPTAVLYGMTQEQARNHNGISLPPAFDTPAFEAALVESLKDFDISLYSEIWTCAVTGTLTRALQRAFPVQMFKTVKVVKADCDLGPAQIFQAPEKYHQPAKAPPPYPACPYTDAKTWQFVKTQALPDALIWNTAG